MGWIAIFIIALAVLAGQIITYKSTAIDSPAEQAIEHVLKKHGLDIDFSAEKKRLQKEAQQKDLENQQNNTTDKK